MADDGEPSSREGLYGGERQSFGKIRRQRKPPSTPYDRPPPHPRPNGWISRLVDPAKRLLSGGASLLPSFFFSPSPVSEEIQSESEHATEDHNENLPVNLLAPSSSRGVDSSVAVGNVKAVISSEAGEDKRGKPLDGGMPDIEQLIKGKTFSRKEIDHLMEVLRSRAINVEQEGKAPYLTEVEGVERAQISKGKQKASVESGEIDRFQFVSTPLQRPSLQSEIGASPVDIARAYMGSRTSEVGITSANVTFKNEKSGLTSEIPLEPFIPSLVTKAPICWPGAVTENQQGYSTPQNQKSAYGIHNFPRTPYSRTIYTKSKSKLTLLRGDSERLLNTLSTSFQPKESPGHGKSISAAAQGSYGSGGPLRRSRNKFTSTAPTRESPLGRTIHRSPFAKEVNTDSRFKNHFEHGSLSTTNFEASNSKLRSSEVSMRSVHPHSSKLARQILEHLDRPVTLKEKSKELKLATSLKNSPAASNPGTSGIGVGKSVELVSTKLHSQLNGGIYGLNGENTDSGNGHMGKDVASGSKVNLDKTHPTVDAIGDSSPDLQKPDSRISSSEQAVKNNLSKTGMTPSDGSRGLDTPNPISFGQQNSQRKPILPSITVGKAGLRNSCSSDSSIGFSFPVTTSSNTYFDLPTPTVMPSSLTGSPQKPKVSTTDNKITIAPPVYSLPPISVTSKLSDGVAPKFQFGSGKARLSFTVEGDDSVPSIDALNISYKFGSGKSRLNFGSIASDALCC